MTQDPSARVAASLALLRTVADEIVVGVDARVDPETLGAYDGIADQLVRYRYRPPVDRARAWLSGRCAGEWLFWLDGDEVPSPALVAALPELVQDRQTAQFAFPRRWSFPDTTTYLAEDPWEPDYQVRLCRNEGRTSWWRSGLHGGLGPAEPLRRLEAPLYHLDLVLHDREVRAEKVRQYDADPTMPAVVGYGASFNEVHYLPELHATGPQVTVPAEDAGWLQAVLAAEDGQRAPARPVPLVPDAEVEAAFPGRLLPADAYAARLTPLFTDRRLGPGEVHPVYVRLENLSSQTWPGGWEQEPLVRLSYHLCAPDGRVLVDEGRRTALSAPLAPGAAVVVPVEVEAPTQEGSYTVVVDLVHEYRRWFDCPTPVDVRVAPRGSTGGAPAAGPTAQPAQDRAEAEPVPEPVPGATAAAPELHGCTIIARNYTAQAEVVAQTFLEHHPGGRFTVLVVDDPEASQPAHGRHRVLHLADLPAPLDELLLRAAIYDVREFCTSVKSLLLQRLLVDSPVVVYLDPDLQFFAPLEGLDELAREAGVVLTPHTTAAVPMDGTQPDDRALLGAGIYNLGFIAVSHDAEDVLVWWEERLRRGAIVDVTRMRFTDQRWVDFVPAMHDAAILRDPGCNVAYWNVDVRPLSREDGQVRAGGAPLRFFHFSGYDPDRPWVLSSYVDGRPRALLSEDPVLAELCADYGRRLDEHGRRWWTEQPYGFACTPSGLPWDPWLRQVLRRALEEPGADEVPQPFDPRDGGAAFLTWLFAPVPEAPGSPLARGLFVLWEIRPDLQAVWPDPHGADAEGFLTWVEEKGTPEAGMSAELVRELVRRSRVRVALRRAPRPAARRGVNLVGYLGGGFSLGTTSRAYGGAVVRAGEPVSCVVRTAEGRRSAASPAAGLPEDGLPYDVTLLCVNADATDRAVRDLGGLHVRSTYVVGSWWWELEELPQTLHSAFRHLDELWVGSEFVRAALAPVSPVPVVHVPMPILPPEPEVGVSAADLGVPADRAYVLVVLDHGSVLERKNPLGALAAFRRAFRSGDGPVLVVKTKHAQEHLGDRERLRHAIAGDPDVVLLEGFLPAGRMARLVADAMCVLSLHRSEGLGLVVGEALALSRPVVATDYSGTKEFVSEATGYPVPFQRSRVPAGCDPYPAGAVWAEPDLDAAAAALRRVWDRPDEAAARAARGRTLVATSHSPAAAAAAIAHRLGSIRGAR